MLHVQLKSLQPFSKPRGQKGRYGNITHSIGSYRDWQKAFILALKELNFVFPKDFHCLIFCYNFARRRGHPPDLDDLVGAIQDSFVKGEFISDDNKNIIRRFYVFARENSPISYPEFWVTFNKEEKLKIIEEYDNSH